MITILSGDKTIYHPGHPLLKLEDPVLVLEDSAAGSLSFGIYPGHPYYDSIRRLSPLLAVLRDGKTIFRGRVVSDQKNFYNGRKVEAEGKLAVLNDSCLEPFDFQGSPEELFCMIIESHNAQVLPWQQLKPGLVTVKDNNDYIVRSSEGIINTWSALKEKCFRSSLGGHIRIRYEADGDYLDWLSDYTEISGQSIEFARNLVSLSMETDATETYTAVRPVGAEVDGKKIDIAPVNGGKKYLINEEKAKEYGIIFAPESESVWEDVTLPENLLKKAQEKLYGSMGAVSETYEIRAVDLSLTDAQVEALDICEYVPVESRPHGIAGRYLLAKAEVHIAAPQNSVYCLGASRRVFSDTAGSGSAAQVKIPEKISAFQNDAGYLSEEDTAAMLESYTKAEDVEAIVQGAVEGIPAGASAYETAVANGFAGSEAEWLASLKGEKGEKGIPGRAGKIRIGRVETGEAGTQALVGNSGTETEAVLDFTIPRGEKGSPGGLDEADLEARVPFRFGIDAAGNYGYYKDGADTVTPFKTGGGGGLEILLFKAPYDTADRYFTHKTLIGNTYLPVTDGYWQKVHAAVPLPPVAVYKDFTLLHLMVQTG